MTTTADETLTLVPEIIQGGARRVAASLRHGDAGPHPSPTPGEVMASELLARALVEGWRRQKELLTQHGGEGRTVRAVVKAFALCAAEIVEVVRDLLDRAADDPARCSATDLLALVEGVEAEVADLAGWMGDGTPPPALLQFAKEYAGPDDRSHYLSLEEARARLKADRP
jgi:hypothetical protein